MRRPVLTACLFALCSSLAYATTLGGSDPSAWTEVWHGWGPNDCIIGVGDPGGWTVSDARIYLNASSQGPNECRFGLGKQRVWPVPRSGLFRFGASPQAMEITGQFWTGVGHEDPLSNAVFGLVALQGGNDLAPVRWYGTNNTRPCADVSEPEIHLLDPSGKFAIPMVDLSGSATPDALRLELLACPRGPFGVTEATLEGLAIQPRITQPPPPPPAPQGDVRVELSRDPASGGMIARVTNSGAGPSQVSMTAHSNYGGMLGKPTLWPTDARCSATPTPNSAWCDLGTLAPGASVELLFGVVYYSGPINVSGYPFYVEATLNVSSDVNSKDNYAQYRVG